MSWVDAASDDIFDLIQPNTHTFARSGHRQPEQIIEPDMRQRTAIPGKWSAHTAEDKRICHCQLPTITENY